jgi:hypothetical protein
MSTNSVDIPMPELLSIIDWIEVDSRRLPVVVKPESDSLDDSQLELDGLRQRLSEIVMLKYYA